MADFRLSPRAETDLAEIADYTIETFGVEQARRYRYLISRRNPNRLELVYPKISVGLFGITALLVSILLPAPRPRSRTIAHRATC